MNGDLRVVVVGSGRVGLRATRLLDARGHDVVMIERNPERAERVLDEYVATVIEGDATHPSVLEQVDLDRADVVAAMTDTMGTNLSVSLLARQLAPEVRTVMRVVEGNIKEFEGYADSLFFPERAGAAAALNAVLGGGVRTVESLPGELEIIEMTVAEGAPVAGKSLQAVSLPRGSLIVSGAAGNHVATSETTLEPGHGYLVAVENEVADEVTRLFRG
jgi:trk system potassium uptake protein TrkA